MGFFSSPRKTAETPPNPSFPNSAASPKLKRPGMSPASFLPAPKKPR